MTPTDRKVFVNLSNHPNSGWPAEQREAALSIAPAIIDVLFPIVPPEADEDAVVQLGREVIGRIPAVTVCAMVQGESTLVYALVRLLQRRGIRCVAATTERQVVDQGGGQLVSTFRFVRFRDYPSV